MATVGAIAGSVSGSPVGVNTDPQQPNAAAGDGPYDTTTEPGAGSLTYVAGLIHTSATQGFDVAASPDGVHLAFMGFDDTAYPWFNMSGTPGDLATATQGESTAHGLTATEQTAGVCFTDGGSKIVTVSLNLQNISVHTLSTPYDLSSTLGDHDIETDINADTNGFPVGCWMSDDGLYLILASHTKTDYAKAFALTTAYTPSAGLTELSKTNGSWPVGTDVGRGCALTENGRWFASVDSSDQLQIQELSTPFDLSTAGTATSHDLSVIAGVTVPAWSSTCSGVAFCEPLKKLYVGVRTNDCAHEFDYT